MKTIMVFSCLLLLSCAKEEPRPQSQSNAGGEAQVESMLTAMYAGLARAYNEGGVDTDSLFNANFDEDVQYVTPWGFTEPIDSTKARLKNALRVLRDFDYRIEGLKVTSFGDAAYAFFILRQQYTVQGEALDEYLPTTMVLARRGNGWKIIHVHRSTDYETFQQYVAIQQKRAAGEKRH